MDELKILMALITAIVDEEYLPNCSYSDLPEEKAKEMKLIDKCLFGSNKRIREASSKMQLLILEYVARFEKNTMTDEEFFSKKQEIIKELTDEEKEIIDLFGYSVFDTMGIYSKEKGKERKRTNNN